MIIPVGVDYRAQRYPVVTLTLIGINNFLFVLEIMAAMNGGADAMIMKFGLVPESPAWYAWFTSIFLHGGILHLLGNMIYLYLFGACVEDLLGRGKFIAFYLAGGLVANGIQVMFSTDLSSDVPIIGASGAISACIGAFLVVLPKTQINFRYLFFWFYTGEFWIRSWIVISFWFLIDFISFIIDLANPTAGGGVAFGAHVGGTIAGTVAMLAMRKRLTASQEEFAPARAKTLSAVPIAARIDPDPVSAAPVYLSINGNQSGPYPSASVRGMLELGSIPHTAYFWREDMSEWRPVSEL